MWHKVERCDTFCIAKDFSHKAWMYEVSGIAFPAEMTAKLCCFYFIACWQEILEVLLSPRFVPEGKENQIWNIEVRLCFLSLQKQVQPAYPKPLPAPHVIELLAFQMLRLKKPITVTLREEGSPFLVWWKISVSHSAFVALKPVRIGWQQLLLHKRAGEPCHAH